MAIVETEFISGAANTVSSSAKWFYDQDDVKHIVYSCNNLLLIANVDNSQVKCTLKGHEKRITCIHVIQLTNGVEIFSASDDSNIIIWSFDFGNPIIKWENFRISSMTASVNTLSVENFSNGTILIASDTNGILKTWYRQHDTKSFRLVDTMKISSAQMACCLHIAVLEHLSERTIVTSQNKDVDILVFLGSVDARIYIFSISSTMLSSYQSPSITNNTMNDDPVKSSSPPPSTYLTSPILKYHGTLHGHEEWVTCIHTYLITPTLLLLATGSKDTKIRLWRIVRMNVIINTAANILNDLNKVSINDVQIEIIPTTTIPNTTTTTTDNNLPPEDEAKNTEDDDDEEEEEDDDDIINDDTNNTKTNSKLSSLISPDDDIDEIKNEARLNFKTSSGYSVISIFLEALLFGHEDWVTSVQWIPSSTITTNKSINTLPKDVDGTNVINENRDIHFNSKRHSDIIATFTLFSSSMDRNMVIWATDTFTGIWTPQIRIGDMGGQLGGSVGGNLLGFVGGQVCRTGTALLGVGYGGSLHLWKKETNNRNHNHSSSSGSVNTIQMTRWKPVPFLTGHFNSVNDLLWDKNGQYIMTVSSDQTSRLFAPIDNHANTDTTTTTTTTTINTSIHAHIRREWKEITRPQVHGYDLNAAVLVPSTCTPNSAEDTPTCTSRGLPQYLITAGDEKIIRAFTPPEGVRQGMETLCGISSPHLQTSIYRAYIPELGLTNKAMEYMSNQEKEEMEARNVTLLDWKSPPLESQLSDLTIWPEEKKLYGHVNDVIALAINNQGTLLVSACKAKDVRHAQLFIWDISKNLCIDKLDGHESSVVSIRFSPDDKYLASSGKDRSICIYKRVNDDIITNTSSSTIHLPQYELYIGKKNAHKRIIWDLSWMITASQEYIISTVSRDGLVKVWVIRSSTTTATTSPSAVSDSTPTSAEGTTYTQETIECIYTFNPFQNISVTSIDMSPWKVTRLSSDNIHPNSDAYLIVVGSENGDMAIYKLYIPSHSSLSSSLLLTDANIQLIQSVPEYYAHGCTVKKIRWCPTITHYDDTLAVYQFSSCSEDHTIRIFSLTL